MLPELGGSPRGEAEWYSGTRSPALATPAGRPILLLGGGGWWSLATAAVVYLLAYRRGIQWFRLIVIGIAISAMLGSANADLVSRADIADAMTVGFWGAGTNSRVTWATVAPSLVLAAAHLISLGLAQLFRPVPVGIVTVCLGGLYLIWLLVHEARRQYGSAHP